MRILLLLAATALAGCSNGGPFAGLMQSSPRSSSSGGGGGGSQEPGVRLHIDVQDLDLHLERAVITLELDPEELATLVRAARR